MLRTQQPVGVILAGGSGERMGGSKMTVALRGRPLIAYPLEVMRAVLSDVAVITKAEVVLPRLPGVTVWIEPDEPRSPLLGIAEALALAGGRLVLVSPADLPFLTPAVLAALLAALGPVRAGQAPGVAVSCRGVVQPLLGCYGPAAARSLADAARSDLPIKEAVAAIGPRLLEVDDGTALFDVDSPDDLLQAMAMMDRRENQPKVKS